MDTEEQTEEQPETQQPSAPAPKRRGRPKKVREEGGGWCTECTTQWCHLPHPPAALEWHLDGPVDDAAGDGARGETGQAQTILHRLDKNNT